MVFTVIQYKHVISRQGRAPHYEGLSTDSFMVSQTLSCQNLILLQRWQIVKNNETGLNFLVNRIMVVSVWYFRFYFDIF